MKGKTFKGIKGQPCNIAYTLDGYQPVKCSWVSDKPLFYIGDYDENHS